MENQIIGHKKVIDFLNKSIQKNKISHAYLFEGPERVGKKLVATKFALAVQSRERITPDFFSVRDRTSEMNPDLLTISPEKGESVSITQIRELQNQLGLFPHSKKYKVAIIDNAEAMTVEAANSLLKTLENPSATTIIILVVSSGENILPTIRSRCQTIKFPIPSAKELKYFLKDFRKSDQEMEELIIFSRQRPGIIMELLNNREFFEQQKKDSEKFFEIINSGIVEKIDYAEEISKEEFGKIENILNLWMVILRGSFLDCYKESSENKNLKRKISVIIKEIQRGKSSIIKKRANARLVLENLLLEIEN